MADGIEYEGSQRELYLTAHHEAGHAVASMMRGDGLLLDITIEATTDYLGKTNTRGKPGDQAFFIFAGPWAEARAQWPEENTDWPDDYRDAEDSDGLTFDDYLLGAWLGNHDGDSARYEQILAEDLVLKFDPALRSVREAWWCRELEGEWPTIKEVARRLLAGDPVTAELIEPMLWQQRNGN